MSDKVITPQSNSLNNDNPSITRKSIKGQPSEGVISAKIGTGENAKNSIIWVTITWSFIIGGIVTAALYLRPLYCNANYSGNLVDDIKATWAIFMPIITLALGYTFGKGR